MTGIQKLLPASLVVIITLPDFPIRKNKCKSKFPVHSQAVDKIVIHNQSIYR